MTSAFAKLFWFAAVTSAKALLLGNGASLQLLQPRLNQRANPAQAGIFEQLAKAFQNEDFDDRTAKGASGDQSCPPCDQS